MSMYMHTNKHISCLDCIYLYYDRATGLYECTHPASDYETYFVKELRICQRFEQKEEEE